jgi:hypothetical protein
MGEAFYFHVTLKPHKKRSGSQTGRRILFLAEVSTGAAKQFAMPPDDEEVLRQEAERLSRELAPMAMTGRLREEGEDVMETSSSSISKPSGDLLERAADAEKNGVRIWILGADLE